MATKKNAKVASKPVKAAKKATKAPAKKAAPVKKAVAAKPVQKSGKAAKPVAKPAPVAKKKAPAKAAPVKAAPVKKAVPVKAVAKAAPAKPSVPVKSLPAKSVPVKSAPVKPVAKAATVAKPPVKAALPAKKTAPLPAPLPKKPEAKKVSVLDSLPPFTPTPKPAVTLLDIKPLVKPKPVKKDPLKPVALPKINATTSRKYEPDFTKSILDQPSPIMNGPSLRYSDTDLQEFRELISKKLEAAKKELTYLHGLITRKDEMSGDETDNRYMTMEDGSMSMEREQLSQMASRQITFIDHLEKAMMRIENKTYGICRVTGKLIDKARLKAVPHATLSIEAKQTMNK